eukprot:TRINITY_DN14836_c0_g1_i1.p1 TRINITY_DN14836_c0_g1~~TRINITY_DN14836_c0_g1_i1.p1  ORF type:complete len:314 (-),score=52.89 TRINITY_DN14836_c0_g1_i1:75-1016(-)
MNNGTTTTTKDNIETTIYHNDYFEKHNNNVIRDLGAGDSELHLNILQEDLSQNAFTELRDEIKWHTMNHKGGPVPRLISIQGTILNGAEPIYRHPADQQPPLVQWTPLAERIRACLSDRFSQPLNHSLIQFYRGGVDHISEHADKSLDIARGSRVFNMSVGATRMLVLRTKDKTNRKVQRVLLPHNSVFVMGWETNRKWTHEIRQDKRRVQEKTSDELVEEGARISLTLRSVATFRRISDGVIFGQGAKRKEAPVDQQELNEQELTEKSKDEESEAVRMLKAFSVENRDPDFDWDLHYGSGFDILNFQMLEGR